MESLNLTVVTSGLVVLFITLTHQPPAETPGHSEGGASRKLVVRSARARVLPAQQGHGDERQPGSLRRRARAATVRTAWESRERERDKAAAAAERRMWLRAGRGGRGRALGPCNFKLRTP